MAQKKKVPIQAQIIIALVQFTLLYTVNVTADNTLHYCRADPYIVSNLSCT